MRRREFTRTTGPGVTTAASSQPFCCADVKEKTPGRRRSTSRRKSITKPEPDPDPDPDPDPNPGPHLNSVTSQDRLSPLPDPDQEPCQEQLSPLPDPDPGPSQERLSPLPDPVPEPSVSPEASLEPASGTTEVGFESSPAAPNPDRSHVTEPPTGSPQPSPDSDPDLIPLEAEVNPAVEMVAMVGGVGVGTAPQRAHPSPGSSPAASPSPQLEDDDSLSPLFQRCLSEDSAGSPTPSLGHTSPQ